MRKWSVSKHFKEPESEMYRITSLHPSKYYGARVRIIIFGVTSSYERIVYGIVRRHIGLGDELRQADSHTSISCIDTSLLRDEPGL